METEQFCEEFVKLKRVGVNKYIENLGFKNNKRICKNLSRVKIGRIYRIRFKNNKVLSVEIKSVQYDSFTALDKNTNQILNINFSEVKRVVLL